MMQDEDFLGKNHQNGISNLTYKDILTLPALRGSELLTDHPALCQTISWAHCVFLNVDLSFLQSGNFLILPSIMTGDVPALRDFLKELERKSCSGLLLCLKHELPQSDDLAAFFSMANSMGIPVLATVRQINVTAVLTCICRMVMRKDLSKSASEQIMQRLMTESLSDKSDLLNSLKLMGYDSRVPHVGAVIRINLQSDGSSQVVQDAIRIVRSGISQAVHAFHCDRVIDNQMIYILPAYTAVGRRIRNVIINIFQQYQELDGRAHLQCGIGRHWTDLNAFHTSIDVATKLSRLKHRHAVLDIEDQLIFRLLCQFDDESEMLAIYRKLFDPLICYDREHNMNLMQCLKVYLESEQSLKVASHKLLLHTNTMRNRIIKIEELLGTDLRTEKWNLFRIYLGFFIEDYLLANTSLISDINHTPALSTIYACKNPPTDLAPSS